jgi:hypothetical protein
MGKSIPTMRLEGMLRNGGATELSIIFKQQVPSPYKSSEAFTEAHSCLFSAIFLQMDLNIISRTLLERRQGNNKRSVLTSSDRLDNA